MQNKQDASEALKKMNIEEKRKENMQAQRSIDVFEECLDFLDCNYLFDGKIFYKKTDKSKFICIKTTPTELKNACIHFKKPKVDNKMVTQVFNYWKKNTEYIKKPDFTRDEKNPFEWILEAKTEISNIFMENDPRIWLNVWLKSKNISIKANGKLCQDGHEVLVSAVVREMNCDFITNKPDKTRITLPVLKDALYLKIDETYKQQRKELIESFRKKIDTQGNLLKFCKALTGKECEVTYAVLYHFIWQVKRKMLGLKVYDHLMPIIYGAQGIGKSEAIKKLLSPIKDLYLPAKFNHIIDEKKSKSFEQNFAMFFDEMQGANRVDIENIKEKITCDRVAYRPLFTNDEEQVNNNCAFIGTSNKPLYRLIRDESGMRRFFEIKLDQKCDWEAINAIDYQAIWLDVDENLETPLIRAHINEIKKQQEENREKHSVEEWIQESQITLGSHKNEVTPLYEHYSAFCMKSGMRPEIKPWFGKKLGDVLQTQRIRSNGKSFYLLNKIISQMILSPPIEA